MIGQLAPASGGLIPKLMGRGGSQLDWSDDPFLAQSNGAVSETAGKSPDEVDDSLTSQELAATQMALDEEIRSLALFDAPPIQSDSSVPDANPPLDGNPFRVVEHQTNVADISSPNQPPGKPTPTAKSSPASKPASAAESQLDRLKIALSQDAKTQLPNKPEVDGSEVARQRVEAMMKNARRQIQLGEYVSALRWASAAEQLAGRSELFYGPDEDPPADLVRILQDRVNEHAEPVAPAVIAASEQPIPPPAGEEASQPPAFPIDVPQAEPAATEQALAVAELPEEFSTRTSLPHTTRAMKEAVIAPETQIPPEESPNSLKSLPVITPGQTHARSLKIDARRVNANQGAAVSVEGQLNPPVESRMPQLPLAPPVMDDEEIPPFAVAMIETRPVPSVTPPPLPPPSAMSRAVQPSPSQPTPFLYADAENAPAPKPVKNVQWDEADDAKAELGWGWWLFPAMGTAGLALLGLLLLLRRRA